MARLLLMRAGMSNGMNQVLLVGNLGADAEVKQTSVGPVCKFNIATNREWMDKETNTKKEDTEWHRISMFGNRADPLGRLLKRGDRVFVRGRIQTSSYEKDGVKKYSTGIIADDVQILGGARPTQTSDAPPPSFMSQTNGGFSRPAKNEEIPF